MFFAVFVCVFFFVFAAAMTGYVRSPERWGFYDDLGAVDERRLADLIPPGEVNVRSNCNDSDILFYILPVQVILLSAQMIDNLLRKDMQYTVHIICWANH